MLFAFIYSVFQFLYSFFIVLRAAVRAPVSLAVLLGFTCLVAFVYFVYFYEQINDDDDDDDDDDDII